MEEQLRKNIDAVRKRIRDAAERSGRIPDNIKLVAVSKTHPADTIRAAIDAGLHVFGENKVQEAEEKIEAIGRDGAEWHLIGHLQSNKARRAVQLFDVIESVDSIDLAARLERICREEQREILSVFIQVDLAGEETKSGVSECELTELVKFLQGCVRLRLDGLMVLPPYYEDPGKTRPFFERLRMIRDELAAANVFAGGIGELSMGMSHDFEVAIEEGATHIRVGTALFGRRRKQ